jgi:hypothetical protein
VFGDPENSAKVMKEMKLQIEIGMGLCRMWGDHVAGHDGNGDELLRMVHDL